MNNFDYWKKRRQDEETYIKQKMSDDEQVYKVIQAHMNQAVRNINDDVAKLYDRLGGGDAITYSDMLKNVNQKDIRAFEYDIKDIINKARNMESLYNRKLTYSDFTDEINSRMKVYNATMRINRLEHLKAQMGLHMAKLGINLDSDLSANLSDEYIEELKRQSGILGITNKVPTDFSSVFKIVHASSGAGDFSSRIWSNLDNLKSQLDITLNNAVIKGLNPRAFSKEFNKQVADTIKKRSYVMNRLAVTELSKVRIEAQKQSVVKNGYKKLGWVAEPRSSTCSICRSRDGKIYDIDDLPQAPAHPFCKCSTFAYYRRSED
ncbi:minor capsid protein [Holzapfeliella sp. He02]|uniref:Minor capsid protein n=1 Tax=Holzapfeliella saturejae TaxID=3082953 RepID=A0ABU8SHB8_9LACO